MVPPLSAVHCPKRPSTQSEASNLHGSRPYRAAADPAPNQTSASGKSMTRRAVLSAFLLRLLRQTMLLRSARRTMIAAGIPIGSQMSSRTITTRATNTCTPDPL
jgi:hypothetical protein